MSQSLTALIGLIAGLKAGTGTVFHQASRHAAYSPSLTVLLCESVKMVASFCLLTRAMHQKRKEKGVSVVNYSPLDAHESNESLVDKDGAIPPGIEAEGIEPTPATLLREVLGQIFTIQGFRLVAPALIYVVQNNLYLYAAAELDPAFFQALWQMRILVSALLSRFFLQRTIVAKQWACLFCIFVGVMIVKLATGGHVHHQADAAIGHSNLGAVLALCTAALLSSIAGVMLEYIFRDRTTHLWGSNVQLSAFSILPAAIITAFQSQDLTPVLRDLHQSPWPLSVVFCQSFNGMMIAVLLKKAGVITNDLTSAVSIVLTFGVNSFFFPEDSPIGSVTDVLLVVAGSAVILGASVGYQHHMQDASEPSKDIALVASPASPIFTSSLNLDGRYHDQPDSKTPIEELPIPADDNYQVALHIPAAENGFTGTAATSLPFVHEKAAAL